MEATTTGMPGRLDCCRAAGATICTLESGADDSLFDWPEAAFSVYVLGNESEGVSTAALERADQRLAIPMNNGVESLNVAVTASLIAFLPVTRGVTSKGKTSPLPAPSA